jgi:hypothetical protein
MTLLEVRKLAIRKQARIRFTVSGGSECVIDEHGVVRVAGLNGPPEFSLDEGFSGAGQFVLEPVPAAGGKTPALRSLRREELEALVADGAPPAEKARPDEEA